jgi:phenylalanyl-tRNA synthetase beta chain
MLYGLLEALSYNLNRKNNNVKLFEFGHTYHKHEKGYAENKHLSIVLTGNRARNQWNQNSRASEFFYMKGLVRSLLEKLGIVGLTYGKTRNDIFSEGIAFHLGKIKLVEFGVVKASVVKAFGIRQEVLFADFNWDNVIANAGKRTIRITELPKYPEVKRDLALLLDEKIDFIDLHDYAFQNERKLLKNVDLFDVYVGDKLPEGKKSYALSFILQDENKTLNDVQIDKIMTKLQQGFVKEFDAELR